MAEAKLVEPGAGVEGEGIVFFFLGRVMDLLM